MTWSILARDETTGYFGIAIASRFFAVGGTCPWARGRIGIASSQALMNPMLGHRGLELLATGMAPEAARDQLLTEDQGVGHRQFHLMDWDGRWAQHTGVECIDWCGGDGRDGLSVAGNMLAGPDVVAQTIAAYEANIDADLVERLLSAMEAGEAAGGDRRGKQAAGILVQGDDPYPRLSLRVDDHADPLAELRRLAEVAKDRFVAFTTLAYPTPEHPHGITDRERIEAAIERNGGRPLGAKRT